MKNYLNFSLALLFCFTLVAPTNAQDEVQEVIPPDATAPQSEPMIDGNTVIEPAPMADGATMDAQPSLSQAPVVYEGGYAPMTSYPMAGSSCGGCAAPVMAAPMVQSAPMVSAPTMTSAPVYSPAPVMAAPSTSCCQPAASPCSAPAPVMMAPAPMPAPSCGSPCGNMAPVMAAPAPVMQAPVYSNGCGCG